jgi:hypothetical protein
MSEPRVNEEHLATAMQDVWNDWCSDTGCVPDGFRIAGPHTTRVYADFLKSPFPRLVLESLERSGYRVVKNNLSPDLAKDRALEEAMDAYENRGP